MTYKTDFNRKHGFKLKEDHSLKDISKITGYKLSGLQTIYNKGIGAYKTNPSSVRKNVVSKEQWAMARVYASINPKSKAYKIDKSHLVKKGQAKQTQANQKTLTKTQLKTLDKHSEHHSKKHMEEMKKDMKNGMSFKQAHENALKKVGK